MLLFLCPYVSFYIQDKIIKIIKIILLATEIAAIAVVS